MSVIYFELFFCIWPRLIFISAHRYSIASVLKKVNIDLTCDPATPFLDIYLGELKTYVHKNQYANVYSGFIRICQKLETS